MTDLTLLPEILSNFRVTVGFKAKGVRPNDTAYNADTLAYENLQMIPQGNPRLAYYQLTEEIIEW